MRLRMVALAALGALVLTTSATACSRSADAAGCGNVAAAADASDALPDSLRVGVANNIAMAAPLTTLSSLGVANTQTSTASTPEELRTNFIAGNYDVAAMPINIAANLCAQGVDLALVGAVSGNIVYLMGPAGTTVESLRGQQLHIPFKNDILDLITQRVLAEAGLSFTGDHPDVELVYHPTPLDVATGLTSGAMQYAVLPEHLASTVGSATPNAVKAASMQDLWSQYTGARTLPFAGFIVRGEMVRKYPKLIPALQAQLLGSTVSVLANPSLGATSIGGVIPVPPEVIAPILPTMRPTYLPAQSAEADVKALYSSLLSAVPDSIGGELPPESFYLPQQ